MDEDSELLRLQLEELLSGSGELLHQFGFPQSRREQDMRSILQEIYGMDSDDSGESEEASADVDEMEELRDLAVAFQFQAEENERSISHQSVINPLMRMMSMFMMPSSVDRERDLERQREESRRRRISELQRQHRLRQEAELRRRREEEERRRQEEAEAERRRQEERRRIDEAIRGPPLLAAFVNFLEMMPGGSREREETNQRASQRNQEILRIRESLGERRRQEEAESATPNTDRLSNVLRTLLGAMFRPPAPQSLSQSQLNQLPSVQHRSSTHVAGAATSAVQCSICLSDYMRGEEKRVLPCDHNFHKNCVDRWLLTNATCPVCRASVHVSS